MLLTDSYSRPPMANMYDRGNAKWPLSLSGNRLQTGGWARQQNGKYATDAFGHIFITV